MEVKEANAFVTETTTAVLKPTTGIAQTFAKEYIKIQELTQYQRIAESNLKEYELKIKQLTSAKNESLQLKFDYLNRNKINRTNSESLLQAKNELNQYKCELKSNYIATEKAIKSKGLHYRKIISSYETNWQKTLEEYKANPVFKEFCDIEQRNNTLEREIEKQGQLNNLTQNEFSVLEVKVKEKFVGKIVDFSKAMIQYNECLQKGKRDEEVPLNVQEKSEVNCRFSFLTTKRPKLAAGGNEDANNSLNIDVSIFDQLMVPSENLEFQNEEEELFAFEHCQNDRQQFNTNYEELRDLSANDVQYSDNEDKIQMECSEADPQPNNAKSGETNEKESQYFRRQAREYLSHQEEENFHASQHWIFSREENKQESNDNPKPSDKLKSHPGKSEKEDKAKQNNAEAFGPENEDASSEGSVENQRGCAMESKHSEHKYKAFREFEEKYDNQYQKNSSVFSDDMSMATEHSKEDSSSPFKLFPKESNAKSKGESEKEGFKSFGGFFAMGGDENSPKPSIFKLF